MNVPTMLTSVNITVTTTLGATLVAVGSATYWMQMVEIAMISMSAPLTMEDANTTALTPLVVIIAPVKLVGC
jgi:hypothetical protein